MNSNLEGFILQNIRHSEKASCYTIKLIIEILSKLITDFACTIVSIPLSN